MSTTASTAALGDAVALPCGVELPNRLAKSAMSEQLAARGGAPSAELERLYARWAAGSIGLSVTGNVMVDGRSIGEPGNVVVEDGRHAEALARWARAARGPDGATVALVQVNHPGRQTPTGLSSRVVAPSAIGLSYRGAFPKPRALEHDEVLELIERFATTARLSVEAGFDGVQLHAAHGYLLSQFLSPRANVRDDAWGGDPARRRRFLLEVARATRAAIGPERVLAVKLNSADFQRGGFDEDESLEVVAALAAEGVDLLEVSGGTYESPTMTGTTAHARSESTVAREAYFLEFAARARAAAGAARLMVTGGFRSGGAMLAAVRDGSVDVVGLARPLALEPDLPARLLADPEGTRATFELQSVGVKKLDGIADLWWTQHQLQRLGRGQEPDRRYGARRAVVDALLKSGVGTLRRRRG